MKNASRSSCAVRDDSSGHEITLKIVTTSSDVIWNYVGTVLSMAGNFLLIPLLLAFLSTEQVGLWYVFMAIAGFAQLLEFGFTATLSRNILYCLSGVRRLTKQGFDSSSVDSGVDWHLTRVVLRTSKAIYAIMGLIALMVSATVGSAYVYGVTDGFSTPGSLASWVVFVISIFSNLYFLYCLTFLRGVGDVAGENKAKAIGRLAQLAVTAVLLVAGLELLAAAVGYLVYSVLMRGVASALFKRNANVRAGLASDRSPISGQEMREVLGTVSFVAWRDGVVSLALYGATQATSLLCSAFLGLEETATYSVMLQFASAMYNVSSVYMRSCLPAFQSAYVGGDVGAQRRMIERGISCYVVMYFVAAIVVTACLPVLMLFKDDFICDQALFVGISVYYFLLNQHSLFCNVIVSTNRIPYFKAYLVSTVAGIALSCVLCGVLKMGAWGLVFGQALPQLMYDNWRWPKYVLDEVGTSYPGVLIGGAKWWLRKVLMR